MHQLDRIEELVHDKSLGGAFEHHSEAHSQLIDRINNAAVREHQMEKPSFSVTTERPTNDYLDPIK